MPIFNRLSELPPEIFLRILDYLYINHEVWIENENVEQSGGMLQFKMKHVPMSAQLIRASRQIHDTSHVLLYANNIFNCSQREGLKLLLQNVGSKNFSCIRHIIIDWEQLQDFAWSLAKDDYNAAMSGLEIVELATWRFRVLGGSSSLWREVKSYERQLCQSAVDICEKHPRLNIVAQWSFQKSGRAKNSNRVKWRFITSTSALTADETVVPVTEELERLKASGDSEAGGSGAQQMIDPF